MGHHLSGDPADDLVQLLAARHRTQLVVGQLDGQVHRALVADVDDGASGVALRVLAAVAAAHQQAGDGLDGTLGGGEPDPHRRLGAEALQPLEGEREVGAALVPGHGVDLVDDDGAHRAQRLAAPLRGDQQVEGLSAW